MLTDFNTNLKYTALQNLAKIQAPVTVSNSSLSEFGVCGFETGYALENPKALVMWEAQFGDFANGAQVVFDQFVVPGESKWMNQCGLVISLPHGYDGQGPEHSSSRLERFLQLSDDSAEVPADFRSEGEDHLIEKRVRRSSLQVCYPSTPANYFHMLRRQIHRDFRKPLFFAFSKSGVRAPNVSALSELALGTKFAPVIVVGDLQHPKLTKIVFCSGQIERKVSQYITEHPNGPAIVLVKLEQIAPFPWEQVAAAIDGATKDSKPEVCWLQEEPQNMGMWAYVRPRLRSLLGTLRPTCMVRYIGRVTAASPASGFEYEHADEEKAIMKSIFK